MPFPKQNYFQKRTKPKGPRSNHKITSPEVQVIDASGENLGVLKLQEAILKAKDENLDLIEIAPNVQPPVCKLWTWVNINMINKKKLTKLKKNKKK